MLECDVIGRCTSLFSLGMPALGHMEPIIQFAICHGKQVQ